MPSNKNEKNNKIKKIIDLLKLALTFEDKEIIEASIETVIDMLEEELL